MPLHNKIKSKKHILYHYEIKSGIISLIIKSGLYGFLISIFCSLTFLKYKSSGPNALLDSSLLWPLIIVLSIILFSKYYKWKKQNPDIFYHENKIILRKGYFSFLFLKESIIKRNKIESITLNYGHLGPELLVFTGKEVVPLPLYYESTPELLIHLKDLTIKNSDQYLFLDELLENHIPSNQINNPNITDDKKISFFYEWGFYRNFINFVLKSSRLKDDDKLNAKFYKAVSSVFDAFDLIELHDTFEKRIGDDIFFNEHSLRVAIALGLKPLISEYFNKLNKSNFVHIPNDLSSDWKKLLKHKKVPAPPLSSVTSRILSGSGNFVKIEDSQIRTNEGNAELKYFLAFSIVKGFGGIKEIKLYHLSGKTLIFNRNCRDSLNLLLIHAPHIREIKLFSGMNYYIKRKIRSNLDIT